MDIDLQFRASLGRFALGKGLIRGKKAHRMAGFYNVFLLTQKHNYSLYGVNNE